MIDMPSASSTGSGCRRSRSLIGIVSGFSASMNSRRVDDFRADVKTGRPDQHAEEIGNPPSPVDQLLMGQQASSGRRRTARREP